MKEMQTFIVQRDDGLDIKFTGERLGFVSDSGIGSGRWTKLSLYRTIGGSYVCSETGETQWVGDPTKHRGAICETPENVMEFFGFGVLAKELYQRAGIEAAEVVP